MVASSDLLALTGARVRPILSAAAIRAAEQAAIDSGTGVGTLMERAGGALAEAVLRFAGPAPALFLCGPGNNGGDGYVAAAVLRRHGVPVRVAATVEPATEAAQHARAAWGGPVEDLGPDTPPAPLLIDCLFGTGLTRGLAEALSAPLARLAEAAQLCVACDLPSGVNADDGRELSPVPRFDLTVALGSLKPAHRLFPAMEKCGRVVRADIGLDVRSQWHEIGPPVLPALDAAGHKYSRGLVHALAGTMPGAMALAASAAARCGAGYVRVSTSRTIEGLPAAVVQTDTAVLADGRVGCLLVGPGLGNLPQVLTLALTSTAPKVIDADAIALLGEPERLKGQDAIVTPHAGEFARLFGDAEGSKAERALEAARRSGAIVVFKGPDTLVAAPDGRLGFAPPGPPWLASAGTGDVLAGLVAALRARGMPSFEAANAAVWLHGRAAELAGPAMIADDLLAAIPRALALLRG
jgi:ADP-dependent NAD(P)H-hydrate dehydratase / NAD(P)H-hydrate epimerase